MTEVICQTIVMIFKYALERLTLLGITFFRFFFLFPDFHGLWSGHNDCLSFTEFVSPDHNDLMSFFNVFYRN